MSTTIKRTCLGPRNDDIDALLERVAAEAEAAEGRADFVEEARPDEAERLLRVAERFRTLGERIAKYQSAGAQTVSQLLPSFSDTNSRDAINRLSREGCGQDWNEVIAELPANGRTQFFRCPSCGRKAHATVAA